MCGGGRLIKQKYISGLKECFIFLFCLLVIIFLPGCINSNNFPKDHEDIDSNVHPYTKLYGYGRDRVNIMLYIYGEDLEDISHMASQDIKEIQNNQFSENVRVFIETNGVRNWDKSVIDASNKAVQRFMVSDKGISKIADDLGPINSNITESLEWFITQTAHDYPAERNILILWGHGDSSDGGLWKNNENLPEGITPEILDSILQRTGVKFETIGFDACGMASLSMIKRMSKYADYMIAASTDEPITGWNYNNWISLLSADTSISAEIYLKKIIQDYKDTTAQNELLFNLTAFDLSKSTKVISNIDDTFIEAYKKIQIQLNATNSVSIDDVLNNMPATISETIKKQLEEMIVYHEQNHKKENIQSGINITKNDIKEFDNTGS